MHSYYDGFANWCARCSDKEFRAAYEGRKRDARWANRRLWLTSIAGDYTFGKIEDRSYFPTLANKSLWFTVYERLPTEHRQRNLIGGWPLGRLLLPHPLHNLPGPGNVEDCILAFNLFEHYNDPLAAAEEICKSPACVIFDIPTTRDAHSFPTHQSVLFEDLMRLAGKYNLVAYQYHTEEYTPYQFETFYLLYRVPREQIFIGASLFWKNLEKVGTLEHRFSTTEDSLRQEISTAYGDLAGKSVLDLGCGTGRLPATYSNLGAYVGVDQSKMMLDIAQPYMAEGWELVLTPIKEYISQSRFHVITAIDVLQHSERPRDLAFYILNHFRSDCILYRTVVNELDHPVYHVTKMGTTSVSWPLSYYETLAQDLAKHCDGSAKIFQCAPFKDEQVARTKTHGIILKVMRG